MWQNGVGKQLVEVDIHIEWLYQWLYQCTLRLNDASPNRIPVHTANVGAELWNYFIQINAYVKEDAFYNIFI